MSVWVGQPWMVQWSEHMGPFSSGPARRVRHFWTEKGARAFAAEMKAADVPAFLYVRDSGGWDLLAKEK